MAQSPGATTASTADLHAYNQAWQELYRFLQSGESFSGRERNCCFLNIGQAVFADISAISGVGLDDDARAIGTVDWDQDGDQDLWVANRTEPRIRYFENNSSEKTTSVSIRLQGVDCSRDAIGARVQLRQSGNNSPEYVQTVRAGSGFLSQSSRWLHFGLGDSRGACVLTIHWPGQSSPEVVRDIRPSCRYTIRQNAGVISQLEHSKRQAKPKAKPAKPSLSSVERTLVLDRIPFPPITYEKLSGEGTALAGPRETGILVNVWASSCAACMAELREFAANENRIRSLGLEILMLNGDAALDERSADALRIVESLGVAFQHGALNQRNLRIVDRFLKTFYDVHEDLSVPTSFLLDRHLRVVAIYRGRIKLRQIEQDVQLLDKPPDGVVAALTSLGGRWHRPPRPRQGVLSVANSLRKVGMHPSEYFRRCLELNRQLPIEDGYRLSNRELASVHFALGTELLQAGNSREAFEELQSAVRVDPEHSQAHANLGATCFQAQRWERAEHHFGLALRRRPDNVELLVNRGLSRRRQNKLESAASDLRLALNQSPNDPRALFNLAVILRQSGAHRDAVKLLKQLLTLHPTAAEVKYQLAWMLATSSDSRVRDGRLALTLARELNERGTAEPRRLSLLAAAYAASGRFALALETIDQAIQLAAGDEQMLSRLKQHRSRYQASKPLIVVNPKEQLD